MNKSEKQNMVIALTVVSLIIAFVFFVPWRTEPDGKMLWAPAYRQPIVYTADYSEGAQGMNATYPSGTIAFDVMALQLLAIAACGALAFRRAGAAQPVPDA